MHVNIVDLIAWGRGSDGQGAVRVFDTLKQLKDYSLSNGKVFPLSDVESGGETNIVLRHLLRRFVSRTVC